MDPFELAEAKEFFALPEAARRRMEGDDPEEYAMKMDLIGKLYSEWEDEIGKLAWELDEETKRLKKRFTSMQHPFLKGIWIKTWPEGREYGKEYPYMVGPRGMAKKNRERPEVQGRAPG